MKKNRLLMAAAAIGAAFALAACGGGGSDQNAGNVLHSPTLKIAIYGTSTMAGKPKTTAMLKSLSPISEAVADGQGDDAAAALQAALAAAGVTSQIQVGVMDSATLHDFVMTNYNGQLPTDTQQSAAPDPTTWVIENFSYPDLATLSTLSVDDQVAAVAQFQQDLTVFLKWQHVAGKWPIVLDTDPSTDPAINVAIGIVNSAIGAAAYDGVATRWSPNGYITGNVTNWQSMMSGTYGNTPNADLIALKTNDLVAHIVELQSVMNNPSNPRDVPASDTSAASAPDAASS